MRFATGEPTAFYEAFGRLLAAELTAAYPRLSCRVRTTPGSLTNIELLRDRRADLALVLTDTARAAQGAALFPRPVPMRAIGRLYETYLQFVVRADSAVHTVGDLAGHTVSLGAAGSGAAVLGEQILHAAGLSPGTEVAVRHLPLADAADALRAGSVDALLVAGGVPLPVLSELDDRFGLRFLPLAGLLPRLGGQGGQAARAWRRCPCRRARTGRRRGRHHRGVQPAGVPPRVAPRRGRGADPPAGPARDRTRSPQRRRHPVPRRPQPHRHRRRPSASRGDRAYRALHG
ncbi:TAXI family TRAP transporter solute-binding subunit [Streptomyces sp. N50]|uniref:TAXI family TRAP transporter solute-binding subunit n=1 Tax=Streptomyces sp. N50 TaxID=3081765 RepID=UPI00296231DE|nr:TAXI family TRAP transporter solute-binding subunit [Streptomyces sp. N50]WOX17145.1 TAXI family TRAP transporter solute-binding subunit [Streptomyces sp. N50]